MLALNVVDGDLPVLGHVHGEARVQQQLHRHHLVELVVLDEQHAGAPDVQGQFIGRRGGGDRTASLRARCLQRLHQGVEQQRGIDGLDEHGFNALRTCGPHHVLAPVGRHHQHLRHLGHAQAADVAGQLHAIHARHVPVQQQQAKRLLMGHGLAQPVQRLQARMRLFHHKTHGLQHVGQHRGRRVVVVHHQHPGAPQVGRWQQHPRRRAALQRHRHPEGRALAKAAFHAHLAAHQLGQALADRQPQAGAAVAARGGGVRLLEALEQARHLLVGEPDAGVTHLETQPHLVSHLLQQTHGNADLARLRELDGVVGVVDEDLAQAQRVAHQVGGHVAGHIADQLQPLGSGLVAHHIRHAFEHAVEQERLALHHQLARLDLGEVQDVVDDAQQVLARLLDLAHVVVLARAQARLERQMRHADDRVHRRADLVAHVGQEVGLERGGFLGQLLGAPQFLFSALAVGDVHKGADGAARRAIRARKAMQPEQRVVQLTVGIRQVDLTVHLALAFHGLYRVLLEARAGLLRQVVQIHHRLADERLARHPEGLLVGTVHPDVPPVCPLVEQGHRDGIDQRLLEIQLPCHLFLQELLIVDIHVDPHHPHGLALGIAKNACGLQEPAHLSVRAHDAPGVAQVILGAGQAAVEIGARLVAVLGMQAVEPEVPSVGLGARRQAHHLRQLVGPDDFAGDQVQVEHPDLARLLRQLQALLGLLNDLLGAPLFADVFNHPDRGGAKVVHLQAAARQARLEPGAIQPVQRRGLAQRLARRQCGRDAGGEQVGMARTTEQHRHTEPQQLGCRAAHEVHKRRVELAELPVAHQHDGRRVVEDGGLLLQQFVEQALAALQLLLRLDALGHVLVQTHNTDALATPVKHGGQRGLVVVDAPVLAPVDELALPGFARQQCRPHQLVGLRGRLAAGHQRGLFAPHLVERIPGVALVLGVDPVDAAVAVGDHHRHGAALQRGPQHPEALQRAGHPRAAAQQVQQQQAQQAKQHKGHSPDAGAL